MQEEVMKNAVMLVLTVGVYFGAVIAFNRCSTESAGPAEMIFAQEESAAKKEVVKGNNQFAFDLYAKLKEEKGNLFFSPYSISSALAMTYLGARGDTASQMAKVLHFPTEQDKLHPFFSAITTELTSTSQKGLQISIANALWGQKGYKFLDAFTESVRKFYGAGFQEVDFQKDSEAARQTINKWIEEQTKDKIKEPIKPGVLDPATRLVLANAIYFKGNWLRPFDKNFTREANFTVTEKEKVRVLMMCVPKEDVEKHKFRYAETTDVQVLELPYSGNRVSMVVLLPKKVDGLAELEKSLSNETLQKLLSGLAPCKEMELEVYLPKFKITSGFRLDSALKNMGMTDAFSSDKADFSGMTAAEKLFISAVLHQAFVDVNEEGTEAAAATTVFFRCLSSEFRADHPFLFLIRDNVSESILFIGRLVKPEEYDAVSDVEIDRLLKRLKSADAKEREKALAEAINIEKGLNAKEYHIVRALEVVSPDHDIKEVTPVVMKKDEIQSKIDEIRRQVKVAGGVTAPFNSQLMSAALYEAIGDNEKSAELYKSALEFFKNAAEKDWACLKDKKAEKIIEERLKNVKK
jgi:serpin B